MVSLTILALVFSVIAVVLAAGAMAIAVDLRARVRLYESKRDGLEGQAAEGVPRSFAGNRAGAAGSSVPSDQFVSGGFRQVPEAAPTSIAPKLQKPPRVRGGFGSQTNAPQLSPDDKASSGEQDGGSTPAEGCSG